MHIRVYEGLDQAIGTYKGIAEKWWTSLNGEPFEQLIEQSILGLCIQANLKGCNGVAHPKAEEVYVKGTRQVRVYAKLFYADEYDLFDAT